MPKLDPLGISVSAKPEGSTAYPQTPAKAVACGYILPAGHPKETARPELASGPRRARLPPSTLAGFRSPLRFPLAVFCSIKSGFPNPQLLYHSASSSRISLLELRGPMEAHQQVGPHVAPNEAQYRYRAPKRTFTKRFTV